MTVEDRTVQAHDRFTAHCLSVGVLPVPMTKENWSPDLDDPSNLHRPYGWVPPRLIPGVRHPDSCPCAACVVGADVATIVVRFAPEIIAEQSEEVGLDDDTFVMYLDVIEYCISQHVLHRDKPREEREALVDKTLWDAAEDSMKLLNAVQMAVLDRVGEQ